LQRYLATAGIAARRKAEELITAGRVTVNGVVVTVLGSKVDPERDAVEVDGEAVVALEWFYVLLNKPKACITAVSDDRGRPTVMDYLPNLPVPVKPVGRLDFYSEGVLLLTNDGELASRLLAPASHVPKTYHVKVHGRLERAELAALREGITLDDGTTTLPAEIELLPGESKHTWLGITIHEGKHRQIHRMIEALGHRVDKLQRVAFANLTFHELRVGDARELTQQELNELRDTVGLDHSAVARGKWRARREATDIPRRARARARAEQEADAAASGAAFEPDAAPPGSPPSIGPAALRSHGSSERRGDDSAESRDHAGSRGTRSQDASAGGGQRGRGSYSGRGDDSAESRDRVGSRGARSPDARSAGGGQRGRGSYSGRGDDSAESPRPSRGATWSAPSQRARPPASGGRRAPGSAGRRDDSAESWNRAGSRGAGSRGERSAGGPRRGAAGGGPRAVGPRGAAGGGPRAGGPRASRDGASASRGAGAPVGRAGRDVERAGRARPGNRDRRERELGVKSGGGRRRGFGPRVPRRGGKG
jgi:pseudouridine synthase